MYLMTMILIIMIRIIKQLLTFNRRCLLNTDPPIYCFPTVDYQLESFTGVGLIEMTTETLNALMMRLLPESEK
jgi:hypothetical protein